ncbi:MAG: XRE family transcriptional regulator [Longimicrobiales bacterium]
MGNKYRELQAELPAEVRERAQRRADSIAAAMQLDELRRSRDLTQEELATRLGTYQSAVSKLERRADMHISTLRSVIAAMGGELEIVARFPEGAVRITQFEAAEEALRPEF